MKTSLLALAAAVGLAIAAPSFAATGNQPTPTVVKKPPVVKKGKLLAKLLCPKPIIVKGVKQCPPVKGTQPK